MPSSPGPRGAVSFTRQWPRTWFSWFTPGPPTYPVYAGPRRARAFDNLRVIRESNSCLQESQRHFYCTGSRL
jgi:hypothetical protein